MKKGRVRALAPIVSHDEKEVELDFIDTCKRVSPATVGFWRGQPIEYPLLVLAANPADEETSTNNLQSAIGLQTRLNSLLLEASPYLVWDAHQMLGYAGRVAFDPQYRDECAMLKRRFDALTAPPQFPLVVGRADTNSQFEIPDAGEANSIVVPEVAFLRDFETFLQKWQLLGLASWDLPFPIPALQNAPLHLVARVFGLKHKTWTFPTYFDIASNFNLRDRIRELQESEARRAGVNMAHPVTDASARRRPPRRRKSKTSAAPAPYGTSASQYENALRAWLLEQAVRSRYGPRPGLTKCLTEYLTVHFHCRATRVTQIRACFRRLLSE